MESSETKNAHRPPTNLRINTSLKEYPPVIPKQQVPKKEPAPKAVPSTIVNLTPPNTSSPQEIKKNVLDNILTQNFKAILPESKWLQTWDIVIVVILWFNLFIIPVTLAWPERIFSIPWILVYYTFDVVILVDCFVDMLRAYKNEYGAMVLDIPIILRNYLTKNSGVLEIVASLPWDCIPLILYCLNIAPLYSWPCVRLTKFLRMKKLAANFYKLLIPGFHPSVSRLMKNAFMFLVIAHMNGCFFWFLNTLENIDLSNPQTLPWYVVAGLYNINNNTHFNGEGTLVTGSIDYFDQYVGTFYAALKSIVFSFRTMNTDPEKIFSIFEMLLGFVTYGSIFGNIESLIRTLDSAHALNDAAEKHRFKMQYINKYMQDKEFPPSLQKKIRDHQEFQWMRSQGMDETKVFSELPKFLRQDIANFLYASLVDAVPLFQGTDPAFRNSIALHLKPLTVLGGWYIFNKGDDATEMYFIKHGSVEVCSADGKIVFVTMHAGNFFGEIALFEEGKRTASVRAAVDTEMCILTKDDFNRILSAHLPVKDKLLLAIAERKENDRKRKELEAKKQEDAKKAEEEKKIIPKQEPVKESA